MESSVKPTAQPPRGNHDTGCEYQFRRKVGEPMQIFHHEMMWQKIESTHNHRVARGFFDDPLHGRRSNARKYGRQPACIAVGTETGGSIARRRGGGSRTGILARALEIKGCGRSERG